jgi:hypothetical protein
LGRLPTIEASSIAEGGARELEPANGDIRVVAQAGN